MIHALASLLCTALRAPTMARPRFASSRAAVRASALSPVTVFSSKALEELLITELNQKPFRLKQVREYVYNHGITDFDQMQTLPKALRAQLRDAVRATSMEVATEQESRDGTRKRLLRLHDGRLIESVLMPYADNRRTACISSQVGCAMGCTFCATGQMGFKRDLTADEIFEQAALFSGELTRKGERLSNVVFMGMGEPFRNYDAVFEAAGRIVKTLGVGARHVTISTVGVAPAVRRFADDCVAHELQLSLAISLHAATDAARGAIMPVNRRHDLKELMEACRYYTDVTGRRVSFEWALIAGQNDDAETARELGRLLRPLKGRAHVNLIPLNPTRGFGGQPTGVSAAKSFVAELGRYGLPGTVRVRRGIDIDAGCGQLADEASKVDAEAKVMKARVAAVAAGDEP